ncbi:MAG: ABC transporter permease subunit [Candidatus Aminicenantes bacterium]|nr:ABC transporter permease subunit [Candidatus Aminicenantes bacterium]
MSPFKAFFSIESKRFFRLKNIAFLLIMLLLITYFVQSGIGEYKDSQKNKERFHEIEKFKVRQYINYTQYGTYGFRLLLISSPLSVLFNNSGVISELTSYVDSGERLKIYKSLKGENLFVEKADGFNDFSGIIFILGSLIALYFGYDSFRYKEYLKFLSSFIHHRKIFLCISISRIILLYLFFLFTTAFSLGLVKINGISFGRNDYYCLLIYLSVILLLVLFFFAVGTFLGTSKSKIGSAAACIVIWFITIYFVTAAIDTLVHQQAKSITSTYELEMEKLKIFSQFEKKAIEKEGRYKPENRKSEKVHTLIETYWKDEFAKIQATETQMINEMRDRIEGFQRLSALFPTSFYLSVSNEISSRGFNNFIEFYSYVQELKRQFIRFYLNKKFYSNHEKVESFVKDEENLFYAGSTLPRYFGLGLALNIFYIIVLFAFSYSGFKKSLFNIGEKKVRRYDKLHIELKTGKVTACITSSQQLRELLYNFLSGKSKDFAGKIEIDGAALEIGGKNMKDFVYLCHPESIPPDIKVGDFTSFFVRLLRVPAGKAKKIVGKKNLISNRKKGISELDDAGKSDILFAPARLKKSKIFLINEIEKGMSQTFTNRLIENINKLLRQGVVILYLSSNLYFTAKISEKMVVPDDEKIENILK